MKTTRLQTLFTVSVLLLTACSDSNRSGNYLSITNDKEPPAIVNTILSDKNSFYFLDTKSYPDNDPSLPIGVFDSGTGGLTVLEAILGLDAYNNISGEPGRDNIPDFNTESFTYLADQANMPYGTYYAEGKTNLLIEHIIKDVYFLLADKYYTDKTKVATMKDKQPVKAVVVACNTATAYGITYINDFISRAGLDLKVFGVIDAGSRGALQFYDKNENGSIGVIATVGTVGSHGYDNSIARLSKEMGYKGHIDVFSVGAHGIAEAVDEERDFYDPSLTAPRSSYRGPSPGDSLYPISKELLDAYNFDFTSGKMLYDSETPDKCTVLQINDPGNYVRYHMVSLLEKMRESPGAKPLKAIILGCTHYPYLTDDFNRVLKELYNFMRNDEYVYRHLLTEEVYLVDPAVNVSRELYSYLHEKSLDRKQVRQAGSHEFYISVPNTSNPSVKLDENQRFTYEYKYGRTEGEVQEYVKVVPFSRRNISDETLSRLSSFTPLTYKAITNFSSFNPKTKNLSSEFLITEK